jgi:hypothetical protein
MYTFNEMVLITNKMLDKFTSKELEKFINTPKEKLVKYHDSLGRDIRYEFKLWENEWKPNIKNGVDHSEDHPEQISLKVIEKVWKLRQK